MKKDMYILRKEAVVIMLSKKNKEQALRYLIEQGLFYRAVWSKVIRKK